MNRKDIVDFYLCMLRDDNGYCVRNGKAMYILDGKMFPSTFDGLINKWVVDNDQ